MKPLSSLCCYFVQQVSEFVDVVKRKNFYRSGVIYKTETDKAMKIVETVSVQCPYCGEIMELQVDCSEGDQEFQEDCPVCCKPVTVSVMLSENGISSVEARQEE
jgi:hypothetical protein